MRNGGNSIQAAARGMFNRVTLAATAALIGVAGGAQALAQDIYGPVDKGLGLQTPGNDIAKNIHQFNDMLMILMTAITLLVMALLLYVMVRFNKSANPTPKKFTHNVTVEVIWTAVPVVILVVVAVFSFPLLFQQERIPKDIDLTIKATGATWNWSYEYPDYGVDFVSNPLSEEQAKEENRSFRQSVDEPVYVPVGAKVRVLVTSNDVIHAWSVPSLGVKEDAMPGRVNETWFPVDKEGTFFGYCQELCGLNHSFMPIEVRAVSPEKFQEWIKSKGGQLAEAPAPAAAPAAADPAAPPVEAPAPAGQPG